MDGNLMADYTAYELGNILKRLEKKVDAALCCCESLDMKNLGLGVPIYVGRFKNHLKIRSLVAGTNMNITYDANTITFDSLAGGFSCSDLASCSTSNLPEGSNLYYTDARVLSYMTGKNISIFTNDSGYITSSALTPYLTISTAASTYEPIIAPGTTAQYWRGDKTWQPFPTIPSVTPSALTKTDDTNVTLTLGGTPATALLQPTSLTLGWTGTLADGRIASATTWNNKQNALSGTGVVKSTAGTISYINGTSGQYIAGDGSLISFPSIPTVGTWGALNYPAWTTGIPFVKMTAAGTFALDTNTYLTSITSSDVTTALGYTPVTNARTLTINGTGYDLTADRTWTIPTFTTPLTTKGDIYVRNTTVDTRLPVGLDTQILLADSSTTTGLKWGTNTAATPLGYYGAFQDNTTQTATTINTPYAMKFGITDLSNGITIVSDGSNLTRITIANTGIYNIQFSAQFDRTNSGTDAVDIWLRKNGVDVPGSGGKIILTGGAAASAILAAWNYVLDIVAGDYYQLMWSTPDTHVRLLYEPAQTIPFAHPIIPSTILTVTQQSGIMAGTGITAINSLTGAAQTMVAGTSGTDFAVSSVGTTHTLNLPTASATNRGALSTTDWSAFNGKLSTTLTNGNVFVGNVSNVATSVAMSGDATIINTGAITIANNAVTDAKLRQSAGLSLIGRSTNSTGNVADITASTANSALRLDAAGNALAFSTAPLSVLISNHGNSAVLSSTNYIQMTGAATSVAVASIASRQTAFPIASTAQNMYVKTNATQSATGSLVISLTIATTPSALSVTIAAGSAIGTFSNTSSTVAIAAGNLLTYEIKNNATATSATIITISTCFY